MEYIKYIFEKPALIGRISCWKMLLSEYDIEYRTQKAIKGRLLVDHFAHQPIEDYQPIQFDFPDEDVITIRAKDYDEPAPEEGPNPRSHWVWYLMELLIDNTNLHHYFDSFCTCFIIVLPPFPMLCGCLVCISGI